MAKQFQIKRADICKVEYRVEERISKSVLEGACPCRKRPEFEMEKEIRAYFEISGTVPDHIDVEIDPRDVLEEC